MKRKIESQEKKKKKKRKKVGSFRSYKEEIYSQLAPFLQSRWTLYILISQNEQRTYCGITTDFIHRFRQHLGLIKGGARYTKIRKGITDEKDLSWSPVCLVSGWDSGELTRKCEYRMHHSMRYPQFRKWKNETVFAQQELWGILKKTAGIQFRLLCLTFFISEFFKQSPLLQITWFETKYRQPQLWSSTPVKELFASSQLFSNILQEYQQKLLQLKE
jgi:predicted GIY-YIG superfamily endonuclease